MQPHRHRMRSDRLDVRLGKLDCALVQIGSAGLLDGRHDVGRRDRAEQLAAVTSGVHGQLDRTERRDGRLEFLGVLESADGLDVPRPADLVGLTLGAT